jgi:hypothetical protein
MISLVPSGISASASASSISNTVSSVSPELALLAELSLHSDPALEQESQSPWSVINEGCVFGGNIVRIVNGC